MALNININFEESDNIWLVKPEGEIDIYTSPELKEELIKALKKKEADVVINGERLEYLDSTGLGTLISILKLVREKNNKIYIKNIKSNIRKLFSILLK